MPESNPKKPQNNQLIVFFITFRFWQLMTFLALLLTFYFCLTHDKQSNWLIQMLVQPYFHYIIITIAIIWWEKVNQKVTNWTLVVGCWQLHEILLIGFAYQILITVSREMMRKGKKVIQMIEIVVNLKQTVLCLYLALEA